jgi:hypothetical protein
VKDEKSDGFTNSRSVLAMCRKYFSQLLNVYAVNDVRQSDTHKVEPMVPELSALEIEMVIGKLKKKQIARYLSNPSKVIKT